MLKNKNQDIKIAVDNCIFTVIDGELRVLLIKMKKSPFEGIWALPGGLIKNDETLDEAAKRILVEQTGVSGVYLEQLYTFSSPDRDPNGRIISSAYFALLFGEAAQLKNTEKYSAAAWWKISSLPKLAYDHKDIFKYALQRLRWKLEYTNAAWSLLPEKFGFSEFQKVYEAVLGKEIDRRNFKKKILSLNIIEPVGEKTMSGAHRPAMLYMFKTKSPVIVNIL